MAGKGRSESLAPLGRAREVGTSEMVLAPQGFRLEPHGVGEILDVALEVFRQRFFVFAGIAFVLSLGTQQVGQQLTRWSASMRERGEEPLAAAIELGDLVFTLVVGLVITAATSRLAYAVFEGKRVALGSLLATVLRRLPAIVVTATLTGFLFLLGFLACFLPGIYFLVKSYLATTVVVLERAGPIQALRRSFALTRGMFPMVLAVIVLGGLLFMPFQSAAVLQDPAARREFLGGFGIATTGLVAEWIPTLVFTLLGSVSAAYMAVLVTLVYVEARIRREGFDLYVQLERARARAAAESAGERPLPAGGPAAAWEGLA